jgi:hypothetical protein
MVIRQILCVCSCFAFCHCTPFPSRSGSYAESLSFGDLLEIRALVHDRRDIRQPICDIEMQTPNEATVSSGPDCNGGGEHVRSQFTVRKKNGHWTIDDSSLKDRESITLIHEIPI